MPCFLVGNRLVKYILIEINNKETYTHTNIHICMHCIHSEYNLQYVYYILSGDLFNAS